MFAGASENMLPAVILGVRGNQNLYLSKDAIWEAKYIPALIRRALLRFQLTHNGLTKPSFLFSALALSRRIRDRRTHANTSIRISLHFAATEVVQEVIQPILRLIGP